MINLINRSECVISGKTNFETLPTISPFPYFMGCTNDLEQDDMLVEMKWGIEKETGMIQLLKLIPENILYQNAHGSGEIGKIWTDHHNAFSQFIKKMSPKNILEIGGGHGKLANNFLKNNIAKWTIIEPNPQPNSNTKIKIIKGFFNKNFKIKDNFDAIVHSHTLEHIYYPMSFMNNISSYLKEGGLHIFSIPNLEKMLIQKYTNCLNFEHTTFITEPYVDYSIFYACIKDSNTTSLKLTEDLYKKNKKIYMNFYTYYRNLISSINKHINNISDDKIYLFGAHIFSQFLINAGLNSKKITSILDNDPNKQGQRLYGSSLKVESPAILSEETKPTIILKAGQYNNEIKKQILDEINGNTVFLE